VCALVLLEKRTHTHILSLSLSLAHAFKARGKEAVTEEEEALKVKAKKFFPLRSRRVNHMEGEGAGQVRYTPTGTYARRRFLTFGSTTWVWGTRPRAGRLR